MPKKAIVKVKERGLSVSPEQVAIYPYDQTDIKLAEGMMNGFNSFQALADFCQLDPTLVRHRLLDPVRCAWLSSYIDRLLPTRLGTVLGAVFARAVSTGDPAAAKMLLQQYKKWLGDDTKKSLNVHAHLDLTGLTNEELERMIADKLRGTKIIDVEAVEKTDGE